MALQRKSLSASLGLLGLVALAGVASAQSYESASQISPIFRAGLSFAIDILVGGVLVAALPTYTRETLAEIRDDPGGSFLWGLLVGIGGLIALIVLAITVIGLIVAIPGFLLFIVLSVAGGAIATVFLGSTVTRLLSDSRQSLGLSLVIGALIAATFSVIPLIGGLVLFVVDTIGLGVVGRNVYRSWS
ncbi:hypothetical protein [Haloferax sp. DFSO52]|uniref:hypothetical protein n=1 Tax=Haloferax sp. DFSO52 TaxID=3388505 RepID=UPI003A86AA96